jgi:hypothetical protein
VRDALTRQQVDDQQLADALRLHAHHYSARMGDGQALLTRLLQESGVSEPIERAVELAAPKASGELQVRRDPDQSLQVRRLGEQLAAIPRAIAPAARISEQIASSPSMKAAADVAEWMQAIANSPGMKAAAEMAERAQSSAALQELAKQHAALLDSPTIKAMAELARYAQSPAIQRLAKQYAEVAEVSRLAHTVSEAINVPEIAMPEIAMPEIVLGETEEDSQ